MDSAYLVQIQVHDTEEVIQVFARNKIEMYRVIAKVTDTENAIAAVQSLGSVETTEDFLETNSTPDDLNLGGCQGDV